MAEPMGPFLGLDATARRSSSANCWSFLSDWLASDPNRLDASLHDYIGAPDHLAAACRIDELRADVERYARVLLGYDAVTGELPLPPASRDLKAVSPGPPDRGPMSRGNRCPRGGLWREDSKARVSPKRSLSGPHPLQRATAR